MDSFASIAGLPAAAALQGDAAAAGGLDARALAATMGLTVDPGGALSGLPAAVGRSAGGAGLSPTGGGMDDAAAQAAIMGSLSVQNREEDELSRAMAASLADGDTPPDSAAEPPAAAAAPAVDPIGALTESVASALAAAGPPRPARQRRAHGASQADADEADDLAQAMAMSMGQPIDRGRRPAGAAAPETPPSVRRFRGSEHRSLRKSIREQSALRTILTRVVAVREREEQDRAYEAGLAEDEARRVMEESAAEHAAAQQRAAASEQAAKEAAAAEELARLEAEYAEEPEAGGAEVAELMLELPTGERLTRRFGLGESGSRVHGFVRLALRRAQAAGEGAEGVAAAVLESGWTMGINFGPTVEDGDATLGEAVRALLKFQPVSRAVSTALATGQALTRCLCKTGDREEGEVDREAALAAGLCAWLKPGALYCRRVTTRTLLGPTEPQDRNLQRTPPAQMPHAADLISSLPSSRNNLTLGARSVHGWRGAGVDGRPSIVSPARAPAAAFGVRILSVLSAQRRGVRW